jgi:hypothetical protein
MSVKHDLFKFARINFKNGVFDVKEIYKHAREWLYYGKTYSVKEAKYKEKITSAGREIKIAWIAKRDIDEYTRFQIEVYWQMFAIKNVKVEHEGAGIKLQSGEMDVFVSAYLIFDYNDRWEQSVFLKFLKTFYEKYLYSGTKEKLKQQLWRESWDFYNEMKAYINLYHTGNYVG